MLGDNSASGCREQCPGPAALGWFCLFNNLLTSLSTTVRVVVMVKGEEEEEGHQDPCCGSGDLARELELIGGWCQDFLFCLSNQQLIQVLLTTRRKLLIE